jgi:hypothetical protein
MAGEIAAAIGYHPGTARRELVRYLEVRGEGDDGAEGGSGAEAVA